MTDNQNDGQSYKCRYLFYNNTSNICLIRPIIEKQLKLAHTDMVSIYIVHDYINITSDSNKCRYKNTMYLITLSLLLAPPEQSIPLGSSIFPG